MFVFRINSIVNIIYKILMFIELFIYGEIFKNVIFFELKFNIINNC